MKPQFLKSFFIAFSLVGIFSFYSCNNKEPYKLPYEQAGGYVIQRESCHVDSTKDYWLIDLSYPPGQKQYGDTITHNGKTYFNVVKTLDLKPNLKVVGKTIAIGFKIAKQPVKTSGCNGDTAKIYPLKVITIVDQGEIQ